MIPNMWYPICRPQDVPRKEPVGMRRLGEDIVLFRDANGSVVCMQDRCAHKGAKLSAKLPGISRLSRNTPAPGRIACPYHGFEYDSKGECVAIPALGDSARIPKGMCLKTFKVAEKYQLIWFWHGDARSEEELPEIPMFEQFQNMDSPNPSAYIPHKGPAPVHYSRWMESVSEFYHAPFLHWGTWVHYIQQYGIRGKYVHDDCKVEVHGNHIKSEIIQRHEHDRYPQGLEGYLPWKSAWGPWKVEFLMPTLVLLDVPPFTSLIIPIPVDDDHTIALYSGTFRPSFLDKLPKFMADKVAYFWGWIGLMYNVYYEQLRDVAIMQTQSPKISEVGVNRMIAPDALGSHWLSLRKKLKDAAVAASLTRKNGAAARESKASSV
jgi:nitrite reductase/ring-hydroxylating ferredoxin subunit